MDKIDKMTGTDTPSSYDRERFCRPAVEPAELYHMDRLSEARGQRLSADTVLDPFFIEFELVDIEDEAAQIELEREVISKLFGHNIGLGFRNSVDLLRCANMEVGPPLPKPDDSGGALALVPA